MHIADCCSWETRLKQNKTPRKPDAIAVVPSLGAEQCRVDGKLDPRINPVLIRRHIW